jgi:hypothetical protein
VAAFKFTANGGKTELIRGFKGATRLRYFEGYCQFTRMAKEFGGEIVLLTPAVKLYYTESSGKVLQISPGAATGLAQVLGVCFLSADKTTFDGVASAGLGNFVNTGKREGGGLQI